MITAVVAVDSKVFKEQRGTDTHGSQQMILTFLMSIFAIRIA
jgi:hypothetical protein